MAIGRDARSLRTGRPRSFSCHQSLTAVGMNGRRPFLMLGKIEGRR